MPLDNYEFPWVLFFGHVAAVARRPNELVTIRHINIEAISSVHPTTTALSPHPPLQTWQQRNRKIGGADFRLPIHLAIANWVRCSRLGARQAVHSPPNASVQSVPRIKSLSLLLFAPTNLPNYLLQDTTLAVCLPSKGNALVDRLAACGDHSSNLLHYFFNSSTGTFPAFHPHKAVAATSESVRLVGAVSLSPLLAWAFSHPTSPLIHTITLQRPCDN